MPYITRAMRQAVKQTGEPRSPGELAYLIYKLCKEYVAWRPTFGQMNDVVGVLENVKHEVQRRLLDPHEDKKRADNGDV